MSATELLQQALELPENERASLARQLLLSLEDSVADEDWEAAWSAEIQARSAALEQGKTTARDWREALAAMQANLKNGRRP